MFDWGGRSLLLAGDVLQLQPILSAALHTSNDPDIQELFASFQSVFYLTESKRVNKTQRYRQRDLVKSQTYEELLNKQRRGMLDEWDLALFNRRVMQVGERDDQEPSLRRRFGDLAATYLCTRLPRPKDVPLSEHTVFIPGLRRTTWAINTAHIIESTNPLHFVWTQFHSYFSPTAPLSHSTGPGELEPPVVMFHPGRGASKLQRDFTMEERFKILHTSLENEKQHQHLPTLLVLFIGMRVMLTSNYEPSVGVGKGAIGKIVSINYQYQHRDAINPGASLAEAAASPPQLPRVIVQLDERCVHKGFKPIDKSIPFSIAVSPIASPFHFVTSEGHEKNRKRTRII